MSTTPSTPGTPEPDPTSQSPLLSGRPSTSQGGVRPVAVVVVVLLALVLIAALVVAGVTGYRLWQDGAGASGSSAADSEAVDSDRADRAGGDGGSVGVGSESDANPRLDADRFTADTWYGEMEVDGSTHYAIDGVEATMLFSGKWDHDSCAGAGRSDLGTIALDDGGCLYGIELGMEHDSGLFWVGQRLFAFEDEASAAAAVEALPSGEALIDVVAFSLPEFEDAYGVGMARSFGRCVVIGAAALDSEAIVELGVEDREAVFEQAQKVLTLTVVEPVNAHRFGAYEQICG